MHIARHLLLMLLLLIAPLLAFGQDSVPLKAKKATQTSALVLQMEERAWFPGKPVAEPDDETASTQKLTQAILEFAKKKLGCRYQSGGKGPNRFDCSGFVGYVYRNFGFTMGDSSGDQYLQGVKIDVKECQPGDLIFFNGRGVGSRVGHVGIVVSRNPDTGQVTFIHASNSQGITMTKYPDESYYSKRFMGVKRIL